jgi:hypothetical protein
MRLLILLMVAISAPAGTADLVAGRLDVQVQGFRAASTAARESRSIVAAGFGHNGAHQSLVTAPVLCDDRPARSRPKWESLILRTEKNGYALPQEVMSSTPTGHAEPDEAGH